MDHFCPCAGAIISGLIPNFFIRMPFYSSLLSPLKLEKKQCRHKDTTTLPLLTVPATLSRIKLQPGCSPNTVPQYHDRHDTTVQKKYSSLITLFQIRKTTHPRPLIPLRARPQPPYHAHLLRRHPHRLSHPSPTASSSQKEETRNANPTLPTLPPPTPPSPPSFTKPPYIPAALASSTHPHPNPSPHLTPPPQNSTVKHLVVLKFRTRNGPGGQST